MQIILEPKVHLVSTQQFHSNPEFPTPPDGDDYTKIGAFAAKGCYDSFSGTGRSNTENQIGVREHRHGSVFEHLVIGLYIVGVTRALTLESNRHRHFAVSQRSTRYTAEEDAAIVLDPYFTTLYTKKDRTVAEDDLLENFLQEAEMAFATYSETVERLIRINPLELSGFDLRKWARGKARNILPHALETRVMYTGNVRAWRWFIEARSDKHAEPEIRRLADAVLVKLREVCPLYFDDFFVQEVYDGIPVWTTTYLKV